MTRQSTLHALFAFVALVGVNCSNPSARTPQVTAGPSAVPVAGQPRTAPVTGSWEQRLPNGESHRLLLFSSGIMAFQHVGGENLPISRAFGRWTYLAGSLDLVVVAIEPDGQAFPLANRLAATVDAGKTLALEAAGQRSTWTATQTPYGTGPGVEERAAKDERDWTSLVTRAEQKSGTK